MILAMALLFWAAALLWLVALCFVSSARLQTWVSERIAARHHDEEGPDEPV